MEQLPGQQIPSPIFDYIILRAILFPKMWNLDQGEHINFRRDVGYYPRCIHYPIIIPLPLVLAEIWALTKTLTQVTHA